MNILIVEDRPERKQFFIDRLGGKEFVNLYFTDSVEEAKKMICGNYFSCLFLDHDLGGSEKNTGYELAKWLEENPEHQPPRIVIHSMNVVGINNIRFALPGANVMTYSMLRRKLGEEK